MNFKNENFETCDQKEIVEFYRKGDSKIRSMIGHLFPWVHFDELIRPITDRVKTYEDACKVLGIPDVAAVNTGKRVVTAFIRLAVICKALNSETPLEVHTSGVKKIFHPIFRLSEDGSRLVYDGDVTSGTSDLMDCRPVCLGLNSEELAKYCGKTFRIEWEEYLLNMALIDYVGETV